MIGVGCKYSEVCGCKECTYVLFRDCPKYRRAHIMHCGSQLGSFKWLTTLAGVDFGVVAGSVVYYHMKDAPVGFMSGLEYQRSVSLLKTMAVRCSLRDYGGSVVRVFDMERCIDACFSYNSGSFEFERGVYYIEVFRHRVSEDKAVQFLSVFITKLLLAGSRVFLFSSWVLPSLGDGYVPLPYRHCGSGVASSVSSGTASSGSSSSLGLGSRVVRSGGGVVAGSDDVRVGGAIAALASRVFDEEGL